MLRQLSFADLTVGGGLRTYASTKATIIPTSLQRFAFAEFDRTSDGVSNR